MLTEISVISCWAEEAIAERVWKIKPAQQEREGFVEVEALILAAGRGERMRPLSDDIPKPLLPVEGKAVLLHILETLKATGFNDIVITVGYLGEKIKEFVERHKLVGMKVAYAWQESPLGSADAIKVARTELKGDFLTMAADTIFQVKDLKRMVEEFESGAYQAVVGLKEVSREELRERSSTKISVSGLVERLIEKPAEDEELSLISAAPIYIFQAKTIWGYLENLSPSERGVYELATALQQIIDDGGKIKGVLLTETVDITKPIDVLKHNFPYLDRLL